MKWITEDLTFTGLVFIAIGTVISQGIIFILGCAFILADLLKIRFGDK